jgi:hypothetical protein
MPYVYSFSPNAMTFQAYDEIIKRLDAAGAGAPEGRLCHASYGSAERIRVFDIWESQELFERFGQTLRPILQEVGVDPGTPEVVDVHNIIIGA